MAIAIIFLIGLAAVRIAYTVPKTQVRPLLAVALAVGSFFVMLYVLRGS
ncbi:hypothetical protein [Nonomuraea zeae]|nr:hypothetical protein [Nonomuraea zeae]